MTCDKDIGNIGAVQRETDDNDYGCDGQMGSIKRAITGTLTTFGLVAGVTLMSAPSAQAYPYDRSDCNTPGTGTDCFDFEPDPELLVRCGSATALGGVAWGPKGAAAGGATCLLDRGLDEVYD